MVFRGAAQTTFGILGNCASFVLILSPAPTFIRIVKKGSVEQFSPLPYLAILVNCMLWLVYGLPMVHPHSILIITGNGFGTAIELFYVLLFLFYSQGKTRFRVLVMLLAVFAFVGVVALLILTLAHSHAHRSMILGVICTIFGTMVYVAPLSVMRLVIDTKSVEFMPLPFSVASLMNSVCWCAYALLRFDPYIMVSNGVGVIFAMAQLVLYGIYYKSTNAQIKARNSKAETGLVLLEAVGTASPGPETPHT